MYKRRSYFSGRRRKFENDPLTPLWMVGKGQYFTFPLSFKKYQTLESGNGSKRGPDIAVKHLASGKTYYLPREKAVRVLVQRTRHY